MPFDLLSAGISMFSLNLLNIPLVSTDCSRMSILPLFSLVVLLNTANWFSSRMSLLILHRFVLLLDTADRLISSMNLLPLHPFVLFLVTADRFPHNVCFQLHSFLIVLVLLNRIIHGIVHLPLHTIELILAAADRLIYNLVFLLHTVVLLLNTFNRITADLCCRFLFLFNWTKIFFEKPSLLLPHLDVTKSFFVFLQRLFLLIRDLNWLVKHILSRIFWLFRWLLISWRCLLTTVWVGWHRIFVVLKRFSLLLSKFSPVDFSLLPHSEADILSWSPFWSCLFGPSLVVDDGERSDFLARVQVGNCTQKEEQV